MKRRRLSDLPYMQPTKIYHQIAVLGHIWIPFPSRNPYDTSFHFILCRPTHFGL